LPIEFRAVSGGPLGTNCYIIWDRQTRVCAVIDPGAVPSQLIYQIEEQHLDLQWILLTHGHFDHSFYVGPLVQKYGARVAVHPDDVVQIAGTLEIAESYFYHLSEFVEFTTTDYLTDGQVLTLGESEITVLHTPGHSKGGLCFATDAGVFCGDTIFKRSIGRYDMPGGSSDDLIGSIRTKILPMDDSTPLYPGHGPSTTVGDERRKNPFLK
jgi:hydroxyacylglutathione hydrolase